MVVTPETGGLCEGIRTAMWCTFPVRSISMLVMFSKMYLPEVKVIPMVKKENKPAKARMATIRPSTG